MFRSNKLRAWTAAALGTLLVAGCSSATSGSGSGREGVDLSTVQEGYVGTDAPGDVVKGGTLSMASFAEPRSLDPAVTIAALTTGGSEMLNIYDTLLRYDATDSSFVPGMAEGISSDDNITWTLTLREGVTFSDGTPLDAAAVKASQERYVNLSGPEAALWKQNVSDISTPDDLTVVYTLKKPWAQFPGILTTGPGMVVGPKSGEGEQFQPIGAGPFTLGDWKAQESLTLNARAGYWDGEQPLESVKFVYLTNALTALESFQNDEIDVVFMREPDQVAEVLKGDPHAYVNVTAAQNSALINASEGRPGADVRIRKALQLAVDPQMLADRAFGVPDSGSSTLFGDYSRWHGETQGLSFDPKAAKELVEAAKADGFDGKIHYVDGSDPASRAIALGLKALWESIGLDVQIDLTRTVAELINKVAVNQDYDAASWGHTFREADPIPKMFAIMHSTGTQLYGSHTSPEMDALLEEFQAAPSYDDQKEVMDRVQQLMNDEVPFLVFGPYAETVVWNESVRGVVGTANSMVFYGHAWKG
ncbi:ABC transporter substrate-binding protein [Nocardioides alcanivorans]|uniref:ABC transporter substrate-binding protein n=1 Tax=Nocardioides alcanivorans TaxID=2897352 RepID=UPI001F2E09FF|nr:ABC transporter substrate-binding protein [Nocardioides alcanivorans]